MSTNVNTNVLKNFILDKMNGATLAKFEARELDIEDDKFAAADVDENGELEIDEILEDKDLYAHFATMYVEEEETKANAKDKEQEKEEQRKVSGSQGGKAT